ncbi:MAG: TadE/TadG family type IV pilus assembly protein [Anaerolineales bacterium]|jgi:hypothetical protein
MFGRRREDSVGPQSLVLDHPCSRAQSLAEFALLLPVLLFLITTLFEASRLFQAYIALGFAAREAARYAVAGSPVMLLTDGEDSCQELGHPGTGVAYALPAEYQRCRVDWIKQIAWENASHGLLLDELEMDVTKPYFLGVYVRGAPSFGAAPVSDHAGSPRTRIEITIVFNHPVTTPFLSGLLPTVRVTKTVQMVNEPWEGGGAEMPQRLPTATGLPPLDTDGDGWSDNDEKAIHGTLPSNADTDGDGYFEGDGRLVPSDPAPLDPCIPSGDCEP